MIGVPFVGLWSQGAVRIPDRRPSGCEQKLSVNTVIGRFATLPHPATCGRAPSPSDREG
jgi:hypothetical protein